MSILIPLKMEKYARKFLLIFPKALILLCYSALQVGS